jgi:hypothetical protein
MQSPKKARVRKAYDTPFLKKLEPKEAQEFLLHHANLGDQAAKEILALVRPTDRAAN